MQGHAKVLTTGMFARGVGVWWRGGGGCIQTSRETETERDTDRDRQTDRQADGQTGRQTQR